MDRKRKERLRAWDSAVAPMVVAVTGLLRDLVSVVGAFAVPLDHVWKSPCADCKHLGFREEFPPCEFTPCNCWMGNEGCAQSAYTLGDVGSRRWQIDVPLNRVWWAGVIDDSQMKMLANDVYHTPGMHDHGICINDRGDVFERGRLLRWMGGHNIKRVEIEVQDHQVVFVTHTTSATTVSQSVLIQRPYDRSNARPWIQLNKGDRATIHTLH